MAKKIKKLILNGEAYDLSTPSATASVAWAVKLWSDTAQSTAANAVTSTANRTYAIQTNSSWQMVVNVPWEDSQTSWATSTTAGTVKLGSDTVQTVAAWTPSSTSSRSYAVQLNSSWQMVVNVPWENTTYSNVSSFTNDAGYITNAVNDLANYYKKSETYTQAEVNALVQNFQWFEIVATLPTTDIKTNVIYLLWPTWSWALSQYYLLNLLQQLTAELNLLLKHRFIKNKILLLYHLLLQADIWLLGGQIIKH